MLRLRAAHREVKAQRATESPARGGHILHPQRVLLVEQIDAVTQPLDAVTQPLNAVTRPLVRVAA